MSDTYLSVASSTDLVYKTITSDSVAGSEDLIALTPGVIYGSYSLGLFTASPILVLTIACCVPEAVA